MLETVWRQARWWTRALAIGVRGAVGLGPPLPPGTLGPSAIPRFGDDRFYLNRFRKYGPIFKVFWARNLTTCIVGLDRARRLFAAHRDMIRPLSIEIESFVPKGFLRRMRGADHQQYRARFVAALAPDFPTVHEHDLRAIIQAELAALAAQRPDGHTKPEDIVQAFSRIATRMMLRVFFGVRPNHPSHHALEAGFSRLGPERFVYPIGPEQRAAFEALRQTVWQIAGERTRQQDQADVDCAFRRLTEDPASPLDETVVGNLIYMIEMGRYDVRSLFRWILKYLSDNPRVVRDLRAAGAPGAGDTLLAESCVLETLRLDQAEALNRMVEEDFVFEGYRFPKGSALRVLLRESHRDGRTFSEPEEFKPCRFARGKYTPDAYAPFGLGEHRCIAAPLVLRFSTLLVQELVTGFDWTVTGDGPRHRGPHHWEPSPQFAISLRPRTGRDLEG